MRFTDPLMRLRAGEIPDPYDPDTVIGEDWDNPNRTPMRGFFDRDSSQTVADAVRGQDVTRETLYLPPSADIRVGDRVEDERGVWSIDGEHEAPRNPFTGRRPYRSVSIVMAAG